MYESPASSVLPAEFGRVFRTNFLQFFAQTIVFQTEIFQSLFIFLLVSVIDVIKSADLIRKLDQTNFLQLLTFLVPCLI